MDDRRPSHTSSWNIPDKMPFLAPVFLTIAGIVIYTVLRGRRSAGNNEKANGDEETSRKSP